MNCYLEEILKKSTVCFSPYIGCSPSSREVSELSWARGGYLEAKERILSFHNSQQHLWYPLWLVWELINATLDDEHSGSCMMGTYLSDYCKSQTKMFPLKWVLAYVWRVYASNYPVSVHIYLFRMDQQWALQKDFKDTMRKRADHMQLWKRQGLWWLLISLGIVSLYLRTLRLSK